jgi:hypothetical protein
MKEHKIISEKEKIAVQEVTLTLKKITDLFREVLPTQHLAKKNSEELPSD